MESLFASWKEQDILLFPKASGQFLGHTRPYIQGTLSMEVRRLGREGDHTPPCKKRCSYVSTPPYGFMTFRGAKLFTFTFAIIFITEHYKCKRLLDVPLGSMDRDSSVGIATGYGLDVPGSNSGGGEILRTFPDRPWGLPSLLYNGYRVFPRG